MPKPQIACQLYTLRDLTQKDFADTVKRVGQIGYPGVELAGFGNLTTAADVKRACDDAGVKICAAHFGIELLETDLAKAFADAAALGITNIVIPWMPEARRADAAGWREVGASMNRIGAECQRRGHTLAYHNHSFEFQTFDGQTGLDILWGVTDPALVKAELDVYWVMHGGVDPAAYVARIADRLHLLHLKDMAAGPDRTFAPVGTGVLDFPAILAAAAKTNVQWAAVEEDDASGRDPLDDVRISFENLRKMGAA